MKKWIWGFAALIAFAFFINWLCKPKDKKTDDDKKSPLVGIDSVIKGQYLISIGDKSQALIAKKYLEKRGLKLTKTCSCTEGYQLWEGSIELNPDTEPPQNDTSTIKLLSESNTTYSFRITPNYFLRLDSVAIEFSKTNFKLPFKKQKSTVKVAILDSGIDTSNVVLKDYLHTNPAGSLFCNTTITEGRYGMNMKYATDGYSEPIDKDGHGTSINAIIAGYGSFPNAYRSAKAINSNLSLINVKVAENRVTGGTLFDVLCGMHYAIKKDANIVNVSLRIRPQSAHEASIKRAFIPILELLKAKNMMLVASAGNDTSNTNLSWPAAFSRSGSVLIGSISQPYDFSENVIAVGAWDTGADDFTRSTNRASFVDVFAPGANIRNSVGTAIGRGGGTSYAVPFVVRHVADLWSSVTVFSTLKNRVLNQNASVINGVKVLNPPTN